jgi:hypothetical protein
MEMEAGRNAPVTTDLMGYDLINTPMLNKGTSFSEAERDLFHLHGLLPPSIGTIEEQAIRRINVLRAFETDFERYAFLRDLQDTNETLFYSLFVHNIEELLPLVYTPTVGEGCQRFSEIWRKPRGVSSSRYPTPPHGAKPRPNSFSHGQMAGRSSARAAPSRPSTGRAEKSRSTRPITPIFFQASGSACWPPARGGSPARCSWPPAKPFWPSVSRQPSGSRSTALTKNKVDSNQARPI